MADLAEEYSDTILHVTTRQIFSYYIIEDTPDLMRHDSVGITTREACGFRILLACIAGVCRRTLMSRHMRMPCLNSCLVTKTQDFGRKIKIAFSGCVSEACGCNDARASHKSQRWRARLPILVGGGLGTVPYKAPVREFATEDELFPVVQAICVSSAVWARKIVQLVSNFWLPRLASKVY